MLTPRIKTELCTQIKDLCRTLRLSEHLSESCMEEPLSQKQLEFIRDLFLEEAALRDQRRIDLLVKKAGFPCCKTFESCETDRVTLPEGLSFASLKDSSFIAEKQNLILYGPIGTGKSHLAIAAGRAACEHGIRVRFFSVAGLVHLMSQSAKNGKLDRLRQDLRKADLVILDEFGYVDIDREGARHLFQLISDCYETKSLIITTNLEFSRWGSVVADEQMAAAMIDRIIHHGYLLRFEGQSYRMEHALMRREQTVV